MSATPEPRLVRRLRARQEEHRRRGVLYRAAFVVLGAAVLAAGVAMLALPGPAFVVIPVGLAILSLEFTWAERLLERALTRAHEARRHAAEATSFQKAASAAVAMAAVVAVIAAAATWDLPLVPWT